jgi:hypothetical protein
MATSLKTTTRNGALDKITTDYGSTAYLWVWSGSAPAKSSNNFVAPTGTLGALFSLPNPVAPGSSTGVWTASTITSVTAQASITPGYVRVTNRAPFTLTQAAFSGGNVTYTGTITGGGTNAFVGAVINVSGFANAGNNGTFTVTASTTTTLVVSNASGVNETHAGTVVMDFSSTDVISQNSAGVGSGDFNFASTIAANGTVGISSWTYTEGNA